MSEIEHLPMESNPIQQFAEIIQRAESLVGFDNRFPARLEAAWLLDGLPRNMIGQWFAVQGQQLPSPENLMSDFESRLGEKVVWRLGMVLRAPDVDARVIHCRDLFNLLFEEHS